VALARERHLVDVHRRGIAGRARRGVRDAATRVHAHGRTLGSAARRTVRDSTTRADLADARLRLLDPRRVLERGYSITRRADGSLVRSPDDVGRDDVLLTETAGGSVRSAVVHDS
jgi:exodeoxyribonuclease VII large subunit